MSDELPGETARRILVIYYDDDTNAVEVDASDFSWLELPELLKAAMDYAELNLPSFNLESESTDEP